MLVSDKDALERLESPLNLINRMRTSTSSLGSRKSVMGLFGVGSPGSQPISQALVPSSPSFNPFPSKPATESPSIRESESQEPKVDNLLDNVDAKIKLATVHDDALGLLTDAVSMMRTKLDDVKPEKIPAIIGAASKVVEGIRKERIEANKARQGRDVHFHFYTPERKKMTDYEVIDVDPAANQ